MAVKLVKLNSGQILITLQHYVAGIVFSLPYIYSLYSSERLGATEREKIAKKLKGGETLMLPPPPLRIRRY